MSADLEDHERLLKEAADRLERIQAMGTQLTEVRGEAETADGKVRAVVRPGGALESLTLDPRAMRMASEDLAAAIVEAVAAATEDVTAKVAEAMESVLPGVGASIAELADPAALAEAQSRSEQQINSIVESLRRGFS
ncbi:YbaB/EbfC family nucleoid-associated protein [Thermasporomyces composti]|jgi:DNA-binding protein YbaB|uniref:YbaB/EbfC DNA-binding family protein n=1 Tax=Thermasporomyces composti TaxID=696763 RepID=A0A3D9V6T1_THECX|nr:YbaB/EbfC family nucleoid-associated protein [Thermasporomyces composti]REF37488.1 YbaB/EbfC DNA-binding family protein [Thermasporomyces composti]